MSQLMQLLHSNWLSIYHSNTDRIVIGYQYFVCWIKVARWIIIHHTQGRVITLNSQSKKVSKILYSYLKYYFNKQDYFPWFKSSFKYANIYDSECISLVTLRLSLYLTFMTSRHMLWKSVILKIMTYKNIKMP